MAKSEIRSPYPGIFESATKPSLQRFLEAKPGDDWEKKDVSMKF